MYTNKTTDKVTNDMLWRGYQPWPRVLRLSYICISNQMNVYSTRIN